MDVETALRRGGDVTEDAASQLQCEVGAGELAAASNSQAQHSNSGAPGVQLSEPA